MIHTVAVKKVNTEQMSPQDFANFEREANVMKYLRPHSNVLQVGHNVNNPHFLDVWSVRRATGYRHRYVYLWSNCVKQSILVFPSFVTDGNNSEFMENGSLGEYLEKNRYLDPAIRRKIILGIARGMYHIHSENIIHRGTLN